MNSRANKVDSQGSSGIPEKDGGADNIVTDDIIYLGSSQSSDRLPTYCKSVSENKVYFGSLPTRVYSRTDSVCADKRDSSNSRLQSVYSRTHGESVHEASHWDSRQPSVYSRPQGESVHEASHWDSRQPSVYSRPQGESVHEASHWDSRQPSVYSRPQGESVHEASHWDSRQPSVYSRPESESVHEASHWGSHQPSVYSRPQGESVHEDSHWDSRQPSVYSRPQGESVHEGSRWDSRQPSVYSRPQGESVHEGSHWDSRQPSVYSRPQGESVYEGSHWDSGQPSGYSRLQSESVHEGSHWDSGQPSGYSRPQSESVHEGSHWDSRQPPDYYRSDCGSVDDHFHSRQPSDYSRQNSRGVDKSVYLDSFLPSVYRSIDNESVDNGVHIDSCQPYFYSRTEGGSVDVDVHLNSSQSSACSRTDNGNSEESNFLDCHQSSVYPRKNIESLKGDVFLDSDKSSVYLRKNSEGVDDIVDLDSRHSSDCATTSSGSGGKNVQSAFCQPSVYAGEYRKTVGGGVSAYSHKHPACIRKRTGCVDENVYLDYGKTPVYSRKTTEGVVEDVYLSYDKSSSCPNEEGESVDEAVYLKSGKTTESVDEDVNLGSVKPSPSTSELSETINEVMRLWSRNLPLSDLVLVRRRFLGDESALSILSHSAQLSGVRFQVDKDGKSKKFIARINNIVYARVPRHVESSIARENVAKILLEELVTKCCLLEYKVTDRVKPGLVSVINTPVGNSTMPKITGLSLKDSSKVRGPNIGMVDSDKIKSIIPIICSEDIGREEHVGPIILLRDIMEEEPEDPSVITGKQLSASGECDQQFKKNVKLLIEKYVEDINLGASPRQELLFSPNLSKKQRKFIHIEAEEHNLKHVCYGMVGDVGQLVVGKQMALHNIVLDLLERGGETDNLLVRLPGSYSLSSIYRPPEVSSSAGSAAPVCPADPAEEGRAPQTLDSKEEFGIAHSTAAIEQDVERYGDGNLIRAGCGKRRNLNKRQRAVLKAAFTSRDNQMSYQKRDRNLLEVANKNVHAASSGSNIPVSNRKKSRSQKKISKGRALIKINVTKDNASIDHFVPEAALSTDDVQSSTEAPQCSPSKTTDVLKTETANHDDVRNLWTGKDPAAKMVLVLRNFMESESALRLLTFSAQQCGMHFEVTCPAKASHAVATINKAEYARVPASSVVKTSKENAAQILMQKLSKRCCLLEVKEAPSEGCNPNSAGQSEVPKINCFDVIGEENIGRKLLTRMGWSGGGLGKGGVGRTEPVELTGVCGGRQGLGYLHTGTKGQSLCRSKCSMEFHVHDNVVDVLKKGGETQEYKVYLPDTYYLRNIKTKIEVVQKSEEQTGKESGEQHEK